MSVQAISWVIDHSKQKGGALTVLIMIANHAHSDGTGAFPSFDTLARESRLSYRQISRIIPALGRSGELRVRIGEGPNGANLYEFPLVGRDILSRDIRSNQGQNVVTSDVADVPLTVKNPNSKQKPEAEAAAPAASAVEIDRAFKAIDCKPFGHPKFQLAWAWAYSDTAACQTDPIWSEVMEAAITRCSELGVNVPRQFFLHKREIEALEVKARYRRTPL